MSTANWTCRNEMRLKSKDMTRSPYSSSFLLLVVRPGAPFVASCSYSFQWTISCCKLTPSKQTLYLARRTLSPPARSTTASDQQIRSVWRSPRDRSSPWRAPEVPRKPDAGQPRDANGEGIDVHRTVSSEVRGLSQQLKQIWT